MVETYILGEKKMQCHEVDYEIYGDDMQVVEVELDPEETVIAEAGAMNWMDDGIQFFPEFVQSSVVIPGANQPKKIFLK